MMDKKPFLKKTVSQADLPAQAGRVWFLSRAEGERGRERAQIHRWGI